MKITITCPEGHINRRTILPEQSAFDAAAADLAAAGDAVLGKIFCRQIDGGPYTVFHGLFCTTENSQFQIQADEPALQIMAVLNGDGHFIIDGIGPIHLTEGQFSIFYAPDAEVGMPFEEAAESLIVNIYFPLELLLHYEQLFLLQAFINDIKANRAAVLAPQPGWLSNLILTVVTFLLNFPRRDEELLRERLWELKMKELLLLALHQVLYPETNEIPEKELEAVKKARHIIEARVSENLSIEQVAELSGIDPADLKKYFKLVAGIGLYEFVRHARLNHAKVLLVETELSIATISAIAGYNHPMDFIQKFKDFTGYTPVSYRKQHR